MVVEIFTTVLLPYEKPNKNKPGVRGHAGEPFTAHSIYRSYYSRGGAARPGTLRCTYAHRYLSRGPIWGGETAKEVWAYFSNILGSEHIFPKHFPSEYLNPCVFWWKLDPRVSDSFTLNLSNCCFVRAIWCPRSFMRVFFFFKPYLKQDVAYASAEDKMQKNVSLNLTWWPYRWVEARERRGVKKDPRLAGHKEHSSVIRMLNTRNTLSSVTGELGMGFIYLSNPAVRSSYLISHRKRNAENMLSKGSLNPPACDSWWRLRSNVCNDGSVSLLAWGSNPLVEIL